MFCKPLIISFIRNKNLIHTNTPKTKQQNVAITAKVDYMFR